MAGATYGLGGELYCMWQCGSGIGSGDFFCNPRCGDAVRAADVYAMRILQAIAAQQGCWRIDAAAGWFLGSAGGARERFVAMDPLASRVAALSAEDLTVRRGATRPDAPWRANAIAAHFILHRRLCCNAK